MENTTTLLTNWNMPAEVISKFQEENIDLYALQHLLLDDLKSLIPSIGLRTKFRVLWTDWKDQTFKQTSVLPEVTEKEKVLTQYQEEDELQYQGTTIRSTPSPVSDNAAKTTISTYNPLRHLLNQNLQLKTLLLSRRVTKSQRCSLAKLIVPHLVETTPLSIIRPAQLDQWAQYVIELFPEEDKKLYFFSVGATSEPSTKSFGSRQLPSKGRRYYGCLWDHWNNLRKKLRETKVIPFVRRVSHQMSVETAGTSSASTISLSGGSLTESESSQDDNLKIVKDFQGQEITEYLKDAWKKSRESRLTLLAEQTTTEEYLSMYPVLKNQDIAFELIHFDYAASSTLIDPSITLVEELQKYHKAIVSLAQEKSAKFRDKIQKNIVENICKFTDSDDAEVNVLSGALLLLPFLFSTGGKVNAKNTRASRAEAAGAFILLSDSLTEGETTLQLRRNALKSNKQRLQPLILAIGKGWDDVRSAYIYVDRPLYRFSNILDAVQNCFKLFFAFDLQYPLECEHVWLFIQRGFFKINLPTDKVILGVNQVMNALNIPNPN